MVSRQQQKIFDSVKKSKTNDNVNYYYYSIAMITVVSISRHVIIMIILQEIIV